MRLTALAHVTLSISATEIFAHPERLTKETAKQEAALAGRSTNKCAAAVEKRKAESITKRSQSLYERRVENAPKTIFGRIDVQTCEPLGRASASIWHCNATGLYALSTGIDLDTSELFDGWRKRSDGTTDDETFLRGVHVSDSNGMIEFLTKFPGYYVSRSTHIHVAVQANASQGVSHSQSTAHHVGQLFFEEDLLSQVYAASPYSSHQETLNRTTNDEDSVLSSASEDGYSPSISISLLGASIEDDLVGYITIGVDSTGEGVATTGNDVNPQGWIPTVSVGTAKLAQATAADRAAGYTS
nr:extracellular dioxygenase [Colletotrichum truncatum]KAF6788051.1 extracellular dioxygenase [Colletotrichum truncatum]